MISQGEFRNARTPTFYGPKKVGPKGEAWLLGIKRYFKIHDYSENEKAQIGIFSLNGQSLIWWQHCV